MLICFHVLPIPYTVSKLLQQDDSTKWWQMIWLESMQNDNFAVRCDSLHLLGWRIFAALKDPSILVDTSKNFNTQFRSKRFGDIRASFSARIGSCALQNLGHRYHSGQHASTSFITDLHPSTSTLDNLDQAEAATIQSFLLLLIAIVSSNNISICRKRTSRFASSFCSNSPRSQIATRNFIYQKTTHAPSMRQNSTTTVSCLPMDIGIAN
jgi:hypothetical protein